MKSERIMNKVRGGGAKNLTLLIPMYNKAPYIERMVKSLAEQTYLDRTEIIVVDDGSTDGSFEVLKRSADLYGVPMTVLFNEKNLGFFKNLPNCYRKVKTEFWAVLDPDDYFIHPERLERAVKFLESHPDYSAHFCQIRWEDDGKIVRIEGVDEACSIDGYDSPYANVQTSGSVFRNFWNEELLNAIDARVANGEMCYAEDWFRCLYAAHFGKVYCDNFLGCVYPTKTGFINKIDKIDGSVGAAQYYYEMFIFCRDVFRDDKNALVCLRRMYGEYCRAVDRLSYAMKHLNALQWKTTEVYVKKNVEETAIWQLLRVLLNYHAKLNELGVVVS